MMTSILRDIKGASVLAVVVILALLTILGAVFVSMFTTGVEESAGEVNSMRALYIAEGGLETAIGRLKKTPISANWTWNDGYKDKAIGAGKADVEVLEYENRDGTLTGTYQCEAFESVIEGAVANPARTVYVTLAWNSANDLGVELYDNTVADCNNPTASASLIGSSLTSDKPEIIRYRIQSAPPATLTYTVRVVGTAGDVYRLRAAHPDESSFSSANTCGQPDGAPFDECMRGLISLGKAFTARREVFAGLSRNP